jgi:hypothetical protein
MIETAELERIKSEVGKTVVIGMETSGSEIYRTYSKSKDGKTIEFPIQTLYRERIPKTKWGKEEKSLVALSGIANKAFGKMMRK